MRVQEEIDQQVGFDRLPEFEDMANLPTACICKGSALVETCYCWRIPHLLIKDDVCNGMFIPAGTNIHANQRL
jgi:hypothetical protein